MRARRWIVPLLLLVTPAPGRAAEAPAEPTVVGKVAALVGALSGTKPDRRAALPLAKRSEVSLDMTLATEKRSEARIAIYYASSAALDGKAHAGGVSGALIMGESSSVVFTEWVTDQAARPAVKFKVLVGDFRAFFMPENRPAATGEVSIDTPAGLIELHGTAVCVRVEADGLTRVAVLEGWVTFRNAAGAEVRVPQGTWITVQPGEAPSPPAPIQPRNGAPMFNLPGDHQIEDPPHLDLRRLLDLPKARHP